MIRRYHSIHQKEHYGVFLYKCVPLPTSFEDNPFFYGIPFKEVKIGDDHIIEYVDDRIQYINDKVQKVIHYPISPVLEWIIENINYPVYIDICHSLQPTTRTVHALGKTSVYKSVIYKPSFLVQKVEDAALIKMLWG